MKVTSKQLGIFLAQKLSKGSGSVDVIKGFTAFLKSKSILSKKADIIRFFKKEWNKIHGITDVEIKVASSDEAPDLKSFGGKNEVLIKEDKSLIAGSVIKIGDYVLDNSIKSKLSSLKQI